MIPWCTYTDPEVAHVGAYEAEARRAGRRVETITIPLADAGDAYGGTRLTPPVRWLLQRHFGLFR